MPSAGQELHLLFDDSESASDQEPDGLRSRAGDAIVADPNGKVTGVSYIFDGLEYFQPAKAVLVGSYTYENARLLLLSKSKAYPNGLGNNKGQVGKHYFGHWHAIQNALFPTDLNIWYGAL